MCLPRGTRSALRVYWVSEFAGSANISSSPSFPRPKFRLVLGELREISDAWLAEKQMRERGFSLGYFDPAYLCRGPVAVVSKRGKVAAFANLWPLGTKAELSIDLMRYRPEIAHGVMDYLFVSLMLWGRDQGYRQFNLGMAPFSGFETQPLAPLWNRLGSFLFRHGAQFYNFQGLRQYKEKFHPIWTPRYLACPGGLTLPRVLEHLVLLISRGAPRS